MRKTKLFMALVLSLLMVMAMAPSFAFAEAMQSGQSDPVQAPKLLYRTHAKGAEPWTDDAGWMYVDQTTDETTSAQQDAQGTVEGEASSESPSPDDGDPDPDAAAVGGEADATAKDDGTAEPTSAATDETVAPDSDALDANTDDGTPAQTTQPLDSIELRLEGDAQSVEYRLRTDGTWSDQWVANGELAFVEQGITGIQVRLAGELSEGFEVVYRGCAENGSWSEWVSDAQDLVLDDDAALHDFQAKLVVRETIQDPTDSAEDVTDQADNGSAGEDKEQEEPKSAAAASKQTPAEAVAASAQSKKATDDKVAATADTLKSESTPHIEYRAHVQRKGWLGWVKDGEMAGTSGEALRVEGFYFRLSGVSGDVMGEAHVQGIGWKSAVGTGQLVGTEGQARRVEAVKLTLTGAVAKDYDIWYHVHVQRKGWLNWVCNGALAGTAGESLRVEALEALLVKKGDTPPVNAATSYALSPTTQPACISYNAHVQTIGWQQEVSNGVTAGTSGLSKRVEGLHIRTQGIDGGVEYRTHVQRIGWQDWVRDGALTGTTGQSLRLEALAVRLYGKAANEYDVYYRAHVQSIGWTNWAKNGENCGSQGMSKRMEAVQIILQKKEAAPPASVGSNTSLALVTPTLNGVDISGWQAGININQLDADFVIIKATEGTTGTLSQPAYYNPDYKTWANQALANGKLIGFYHYANGGDPIEEADWFYYAVKDYRGRAIVALDWEGAGNHLFDTGQDVAWCKKFLDRLQSKMGGTPFLYTSKNYTNAYDWSSVAAKYPLWGAQYPDMEPQYGYLSDPWQSKGPWGAWGYLPTIFQYSGTGVLKYSGGMDQLDINIFYGNSNDWMSYTR